MVRECNDVHWSAPNAHYVRSALRTGLKDEEKAAPVVAAAAVDPGMVPGMGGMMMYEGNVRSGQQVIAPPGQSLMVYGSVNPGGEVLADGSIFIWGALNGRALAGISSSSSEDSSGSSSSSERFTLQSMCRCFEA